MVCIFLFALLILQEVNGVVNEYTDVDVSNPSEKIDTEIYSYVMGLVMTVIIFVSVVFEFTEEKSMENASDWMKPIVATLFGEMTILGFIGLVMFSITKVGKETFDSLACNPEYGFFKHDEEACINLHGLNESTVDFIPKEILERGWICLENPLIELTENAHMTLFGVMMLFLLIVVSNIYIGRRQLKFWRFCEDHCIVFSMAALREEEASAFDNLKKNSCWYCCPIFCRCIPSSCLTNTHSKRICCRAHLIGEHLIAARRLRFAASRLAFIKGNNDRARDDDHKLSSHFDYTTYLGQVMTEKLSEIIELKISNWLAIYTIFMSFVFASYILRLKGMDESFLSISLCLGAVICIWISFIIISYINRKVHAISTMLVHPGHLPMNSTHRLKWEELIDRYVQEPEGKSDRGSPIVFKTYNDDDNDDDHTNIRSVTNQDDLKVRSIDSWNNKEALHQPLLPIDDGENNKTTKENFLKRSLSRTKHIHDISQTLKRRSSLSSIRNVPSPTSTSTLPNSPHVKIQRRHSVEGADKMYKRTLTQKKLDLFAKCDLLDGSEDVSLPLFQYHYDGTERDQPTKDCLGKRPNLHEALFWGLKQGHEMVFSYLTSTMLMIAVFVGTLFVNFSGPVYIFVENKYLLAVLYVIAFFPVLGHMIEFSILLPKLLLITSIHNFQNSTLTARTTHIMRSRKALRMLMYACAIKDAHKVAMRVRTKGLRGSTFSKLSKKEKIDLETLLYRKKQIRTFSKGHDVITQGEHNQFLHVIISGECNVIVKGKQVATLCAPQEFGLLSLLNGVRCTATIRASARESLVCYLLDIETYNTFFKAKSKMAMAVANSEASMKNAVAFHEDSDDEQDHGERKKNNQEDTVLSIHGEAVTNQPSLHPNHLRQPTSSSITAVANAVNIAHRLAAKKYKKRHARTRKVGEMSFAQRVRRGGRKKEAMEAYRRGALVDLFVVMDKDMSGRVDEFELTHFLTTLFCSEGKKLGDAEVRQIELMIAGLDEDGDGEVSVTEFLNVMEPIVSQMEEEETPDEITHRMWEVLDVDGGGSVTISEFRDVLEKVGLTMSYEEVRELFAEFDDDGSGALEEEELLAFIKSSI